MGYIAQYNECGFRCEVSEDIASERSENRHFRPLHSHLTPPLQRTSTNIRIKLTLLETKILALHFCRWQYGSIFIQIFVVVSETHVCSATECILVVFLIFAVSYLSLIQHWINCLQFFIYNTVIVVIHACDQWPTSEASINNRIINAPAVQITKPPLPLAWLMFCYTDCAWRYLSFVLLCVNLQNITATITQYK